MYRLDEEQEKRVMNEIVPKVLPLLEGMSAIEVQATLSYISDYVFTTIPLNPSSLGAKGVIFCATRDALSPSEALFGFAGWLTTRSKSVTFSSHDNAGPAAELVDTFCKVNKMEEPRERWEKLLIHPKETDVQRD